MAGIDPRIDAYIEKSADFAKPILNQIRATVHKACPGVEETIKWGFPHFNYNGAILCSMASFKQHCAFGFWKASLMTDPEGLFNKNGHNAMGQFDRIASLKDLPPFKILKAYINEAAQLNATETKVPGRSKQSKPKEIILPGELTDALTKNKKAKATFDAFSLSNKREYTDWIAEAKTATTRAKRVQQAMEWLEAGKIRNWKYVNKQA